MYDALLDTIGHFLKNGLSWASLGGVLLLMLKNRRLKRVINRRLPRVIRDLEDDKLDLIARRQLAIMNHLGVREECAPTYGPITPHSTKSGGVGFMFSLAGGLAARSARQFMLFPKRGKSGMSKWFRADSLTIIGAFVVGVLNQYFGWDLPQDNLVAAFLMTLSLIKATDYINIVKDASGIPRTFQFNSRKIIFTIVGVVLVAVDMKLQLGIDQEMLYGLAALVSGYNLYEGKKDAKEIEKNSTQSVQIQVNGVANDELAKPADLSGSDK